MCNAISDIEAATRSTNLLQSITKKLIVVAFFTFTAAFTSAQSAESANSSSGASQSASSMTEEERQQWIENRLTAFDDIIAKDLQAREQLAVSMDDMVSKKQDDRKSVCKTTDILLEDYYKAVAKLNQMILDLEKYQDRLNEAQRSRLLASKAKIPELMSKIRGCEKY
ncbi:MAG: hypothetical protein ABUL58_00870 [Steroidobacter sp.]